MPQSLSQSRSQAPFHWALFLVFLVSNMLLSYFSLSLQSKLWIGLFGLLLPFIWGLLHAPPADPPELFQKDFLSPIPAWAWLPLAAAAVFFRFYRLTTLSVWPNYDDGLWGFFAIHFIHHWDWNPFYQDNSYPSTYAWGLALLFKCFGSSLFMLWFYPALLSLLVVPTGYLACRRILSRSHSFFIALFLGLGFWPMFVGRFGNQQILTLLWECLWLWVLAGLGRRASPADPGLWELLGLGTVTALGFYIYISWVAVAFFTAVTVVVSSLARPRWSLRAHALFWGAFGLALAPLADAGLIHNYGRIVHDIGSLHTTVPWSERLATGWGYVSALFWGMPAGKFSYQPIWGGLLDPLLGSLFFLGLSRILRAWRHPFCLWLLTGLALFFIPGTLTHDVEPFRNLPLIPLLGVVCAAGISALLDGLPTPKRWFWFISLVLAFAGLDFYHLAVRYHHIWDLASTWKGYAKPMERYRAFQILDRTRREEGPGLIYSNFTPGLCDQTLSVADHAFNAAENPDLSWKDARWAALLANADYKPFLQRRFPDGTAYYLSSGLEETDSGQMLWVMPVSPDKIQALSRWQAANQAYCCFPGRYYNVLRDNLAKAYPFFQGDPFLVSCFWEKMADLDFRVGRFADVQKPMADLEEGLKRGYGAAHLYQRLAVFCLILSKKSEAEDFLRKAVAAPLDLTDSRQLLESLEKKSRPEPAGTLRN